MEGLRWALLTFLLLSSPSALLGDEVVAKDIAFPSGITLRPVAEIPRFPDVEQTGSQLYKVGLGGVTDARRLSLTMSVAEFRDKSADYFRAHPVFVTCLQETWSELQNAGHQMRLVDGFRASSGDSVRDRYRRSGTGAAFAYTSSSAKKDFKAMVTAFLRHCPPLFAPLGRDLGLIAEADRVFVYMTGERSPSQQALSVAGNAAFAGIDINAWARQRFNELTQPTSVPTCGAEFVVLPTNGVHPTGASTADPAPTVGEIDKPVLRATADPERQDLLRLVQFPSDNVLFAVPAATPTCPAAGGLHGSGATTRCGPRLMAPRLFAKMNVLQSLVRSGLSLQLRVVAGWNGSEVTAAEALRREARMVKVQLTTSNTAERLGQAARLAVCAGMDYVRHGGDHLVLAVAKQLKVSTKPVSFPNAELLPVAAPTADWESLYKTDDTVDADDYPLFDSKYKPTAQLMAGVPVSAFKSREDDVRYFRVSKDLAKCHSEVLRWENRDIPSSQPRIKVRVVRAFMSNMEERSAFNPISDPRLNKHTRGVAMHLAYDGAPKGYDQWRLARTVAAVCPFVFQTREEGAGVGRSAGLGVYTDGVYVDMREATTVWFECDDCERLVPPGGAKKVKDDLMLLMAQSKGNRIIDPSNKKVACEFDDPPKPQSPDFIHRHSTATLRLKRSAPATGECSAIAPMSDFCRKSLAQRRAEVNKVWSIITRKHLLVDKTKLKKALDGCLIACSKCTSGPQWNAKVENCNNLVHWIPFEPLNDQAGAVTNVFPRIDDQARERACEGGEHCVDLSPLFAIIAPVLDATFQPVAGKANREMVYDSVENPSPLLGQIARLYALTARGQVKVWLRSEADVASMEEALKVLFVYNTKVTGIQVRVLDHSALGIITSTLEGRLEAWRTSVCPSNSRLALTPYVVSGAPTPAASTYQFDLRHRLREDQRRLDSEGLRPDFI